MKEVYDSEAHISILLSFCRSISCSCYNST